MYYIMETTKNVALLKLRNTIYIVILGNETLILLEQGR